MLPATGRVRPSRTRSISRDRSLERLSADSPETVSRLSFRWGQSDCHGPPWTGREAWVTYGNGRTSEAPANAAK